MAIFYSVLMNGSNSYNLDTFRWEGIIRRTVNRRELNRRSTSRELSLLERGKFGGSKCSRKEGSILILGEGMMPSHSDMGTLLF